MSGSVDPWLLAEDDPPCEGPCWCHDTKSEHDEGGEG